MTALGPTPLPVTPEGETRPTASWYRRLYLRVEALSSSRHALAAMLLVAIVDGSFFPVPPFALLVPMVLARPREWVRLALAGTVASLLGGAVGYYVGTLMRAGAVAFLHTDLEVPIRSSLLGVDTTLRVLLSDNLWSLMLATMLTPLYKLVTIGSGLVGVPFGKFVLASLVGRTARFFVIAGLMAYAGPKARKWLRV